MRAGAVLVLVVSTVAPAHEAGAETGDTPEEGSALDEGGSVPGGVPGEEILVIEPIDGDPGAVVRQEDIVRRGASTLAEIVEHDVAVSSGSDSRGERPITVRGFHQRQIAIFIDGVPTTIPYDGMTDLGKLSAGFVESVELLAGPDAGLYGPTGLGGALLIDTLSPPEQLEAWARTRVGLHGSLEGLASAGGPMREGDEPLLVRLSGGGQASPGFPLSASFKPTDREDGGLRDASDRRSHELQARMERSLGRAGRVEAGARFTSGEYGVPTGLQDEPPRYWRFSTFEDLGAFLRHRAWVGPRFSVRESVFGTWNRNVLDSYDDDTRSTQESAAAFHSTYLDHRYGGAVQATGHTGTAAAPSALLRARALLDHQVHDSSSDASAPEDVGTTLISGALSAERLAGILGAFVGVEGSADLPRQGSGLEAPPAFVGPVAGLRLRGSEWLEAALGVSRRCRFPTLKERFSSAMGYRVPNLELEPERAWHLGLNTRLRVGSDLSVSMTAYDAEVQGLIETAYLDDGEEQLRNTGRARLAGAEATLVTEPLHWLLVETAFAWLHARKLGLDSPDDRLEYRPRWQATLAMTATPLDSLEIWTVLRATGPQHFLDRKSDRWGTLGATMTWDVAVCLHPDEHLDIRLRGKNLLDRDVQSRYGFPDPGRQVTLEVEVRR